MRLGVMTPFLYLNHWKKEKKYKRSALAEPPLELQSLNYEELITTAKKFIFNLILRVILTEMLKICFNKKYI